jgi:hypothetical protein
MEEDLALYYESMIIIKFDWNWPTSSLGFYVPLKNPSLLRRRHHYRWRGAKYRPTLGAQGLWAGRDFYRATAAVIRDFGFPVSSEGPPQSVASYDTHGDRRIYSNPDHLVYDYFQFYVPLKNFSLIWRRHHCRWRAAKFRPMLGAQGLWAGRDLYHATPSVTQGLGFSGLIWRTAPFSRLLRHTPHEGMCRIYSNPNPHGAPDQRIFLKTSCKNDFFYCGPAQSRGLWFVTNLNCTIGRSFCVNLSFCSFVSLKKIFKMTLPYFCDYFLF